MTPPCTTVITCQTLLPELQAVLAAHDGPEVRVIPLPAGLHAQPSQLRDQLQYTLNTLNTLPPTGRVLLVYGYCGGGLDGLTTGDYTLIVPRVDDCISLLLGGTACRKQLPDAAQTFFLTQGWLEEPLDPAAEYRRWVEQYGQPDADMIAGTLYRHYTGVALIDTGLPGLQPLWQRACQTAACLGLPAQVVPGTTRLLTQLVYGPHPPELFCTLPPHSRLCQQALLPT